MAQLAQEEVLEETDFAESLVTLDEPTLADVISVSTYSNAFDNRWGYRFVKRTLDIVLSIIGLIVLAVLFPFIALAIYIDDPGPILFHQERNGLHGKVFQLWKFRTMIKDAPQQRAELEKHNELDGPAFKMANDPRITRVGRFLRKTSIDELPQLVNILFGHMSVVGPRPFVTYETDLLSRRDRFRMSVKPGLICYWQVSGRNNVPFREWMEMDYQYINDACLYTDLKIFMKAIPAVFGMRGAA
jgi:lipopolysaccharide/colanic/teichoic acid biosynthesis glycosyltransferase